MKLNDVIVHYVINSIIMYSRVAGREVAVVVRCTT